MCEVLSPGNEALDRVRKMRLYARAGVRHAWLVNPRERTLEAFRLEGTTLVGFAVSGEDEHVRADPFSAFELDLSLLWAGVPRE